MNYSRRLSIIGIFVIWILFVVDSSYQVFCNEINQIETSSSISNTEYDTIRHPHCGTECNTDSATTTTTTNPTNSESSSSTNLEYQKAKLNNKYYYDNTPSKNDDKIDRNCPEVVTFECPSGHYFTVNRNPADSSCPQGQCVPNVMGKIPEKLNWFG